MLILKRTSNQNGFVLALTLLCALVLSSVMMSTMFISTKGGKVSKNFKESVQTLNAADAAVKKAKSELTKWLITQQVGTGTMVNFTTILTNSASAGYLSIPGSTTNWGNATFLGSAVVVTVVDDEGAADTDRIIKLVSTATSSSRQQVKIDAYVQAPSTGNVTGVPPVLGASTFCNDSLGREQRVSVTQSSLLDGRNYALPAWPRAGAACDVAAPLGSGHNPPAILFNATKQGITTATSGTYTGSPTTWVVAGSSTNCDQWFDYANQIALLSDSLPYVNVIDGDTVTSTDLGTRSQPVIAIMNGAITPTRRGSTRSTVFSTANARGSGIMLMQWDASQNSAGVAMGTKDNFYYEGVVVVYGDERAGYMTYGSQMYGALVMLTGSDNTTYKERLKLRVGSEFKYSAQGVTQANIAMGAATAAATPITSPNDPRNQVVTVGWAEVYSGG